VVREFRSIGPFVPNREIAEIGFFLRRRRCQRKQRARIDEALAGAPVSAYW
jgi:hypothetical protein